MATQNKPTHRLKMLNKNTGERGEIGAGWENEDGSITIQLNPFVVISSADKHLVINLFPAEYDPRMKRVKKGAAHE